MQLEVRVAAGGDHRLALRKEVSAEAHSLVVWLDEQVDEMVAANRDMTDRRTIDGGYPCLELGFGQEPIVESSAGVAAVRSAPACTSELPDDADRHAGPSRAREMVSHESLADTPRQAGAGAHRGLEAVLDDESGFRARTST